jgi:hypothetical protein
MSYIRNKSDGTYNCANDGKKRRKSHRRSRKSSCGCVDDKKLKSCNKCGKKQDGGCGCRKRSDGKKRRSSKRRSRSSRRRRH